MFFIETKLNFIISSLNKIQSLEKNFPNRVCVKYLLFNKSFGKSFHKETKKTSSINSKWVSLLGPSGGFLGVGTSELVVIGIVAWLVLGPKRLYQLVKDVGKISAEVKNVAEQAKATFNQSIEIEPESSMSSRPRLSKDKLAGSEKNQNKEDSINFDKKVENEIVNLFNEK